MDHTNAKQVTKALLAACFVFVIIAGGAFALSTIVSNHLSDGTTVTDSPLSLVETVGLPDTTAKGVAYYMDGTLTANVDCGDPTIYLTIGGTSILASDVTVRVSIGGGAYSAVSFVQGIDELTVSIAVIDGAMTAGESMTISFEFVFNDTGAFTTKYYAEASA